VAKRKTLRIAELLTSFNRAQSRGHQMPVQEIDLSTRRQAYDEKTSFSARSVVAMIDKHNKINRSYYG
jgi:hypothetical protein